MAEKSHGSWIKLYLEGNTSEVLRNLGKKVLRQYLEAIRVLSNSLSKQVAQYDTYSMIVGTIIVLEVRLSVLKPSKFSVQSISHLHYLFFKLGGSPT